MRSSNKEHQETQLVNLQCRIAEIEQVLKKEKVDRARVETDLRRRITDLQGELRYELQDVRCNSAEVEQTVKKEKFDRERVETDLCQRIIVLQREHSDLLQYVRVMTAEIVTMNQQTKELEKMVREAVCRIENVEACQRCINEPCEKLQINRNNKEEESAPPGKMKKMAAGVMTVTVTVAMVVGSFINSPLCFMFE